MNEYLGPYGPWLRTSPFVSGGSGLILQTGDPSLRLTVNGPCRNWEGELSSAWDRSLPWIFPFSASLLELRWGGEPTSDWDENPVFFPLRCSPIGISHYRDGRRVSCPTWGSVSGQSPFRDLLRDTMGLFPFRPTRETFPLRLPS